MLKSKQVNGRIQKYKEVIKSKSHSLIWEDDEEYASIFNFQP